MIALLAALAVNGFFRFTRISIQPFQASIGIQSGIKIVGPLGGLWGVISGSWFMVIGSWLGLRLGSDWKPTGFFSVDFGRPPRLPLRRLRSARA